jgi:hypothetical protein
MSGAFKHAVEPTDAHRRLIGTLQRVHQDAKRELPNQNVVQVMEPGQGAGGDGGPAALAGENAEACAVGGSLCDRRRLWLRQRVLDPSLVRHPIKAWPCFSSGSSVTFNMVGLPPDRTQEAGWCLGDEEFPADVSPISEGKAQT